MEPNINGHIITCNIYPEWPLFSKITSYQLNDRYNDLYHLQHGANFKLVSVKSCVSFYSVLWLLMTWPHGEPGGHLSIKMPSYQCKDSSHYKNKMIWWPSYLHDRNPFTRKHVFIFRKGPWYVQALWWLNFGPGHVYLYRTNWFNSSWPVAPYSYHNIQYQHIRKDIFSTKFYLIAPATNHFLVVIWFNLEIFNLVMTAKEMRNILPNNYIYGHTMSLLPDT